MSVNIKGFSLKPNGYYEITVGENKGRSIHDVIVETIIGRRLNPNEVVHHINEIKTDNRPENLKLMTRSEHQSIHGKENYKNGTCYDISKHSKSGEDHANSFLKEMQVIEIFNSKDKHKDISEKYNVSISCIKHIKAKRTWKHLNL